MKIVFQGFAGVSYLDIDGDGGYEYAECEIGDPCETLAEAKQNFPKAYWVWRSKMPFRECEDPRPDSLFIRPVVEGAVDTPIGFNTVGSLEAG